MLTIYRDKLPDSYLLIVASVNKPQDPTALDRALHRAGRSGKRNVWLDCSLWEARDVSSEACLLLRAYHDAFAALGINMVLAHAPEKLQHCLETNDAAPAPRLVEWLVESFRRN